MLEREHAGGRTGSRPSPGRSGCPPRWSRGRDGDRLLRHDAGVARAMRSTSGQRRGRRRRVPASNFPPGFAVARVDLWLCRSAPRGRSVVPATARLRTCCCRRCRRFRTPAFAASRGQRRDEVASSPVDGSVGASPQHASSFRRWHRCREEVHQRLPQAGAALPFVYASVARRVAPQEYGSPMRLFPVIRRGLTHRKPAGKSGSSQRPAVGPPDRACDVTPRTILPKLPSPYEWDSSHITTTSHPVGV